MMFEKINLFKFFKSSWCCESKNKDENEIGLNLISENEEKVFCRTKDYRSKRKSKKKISNDS